MTSNIEQVIPNIEVEIQGTSHELGSYDVGDFH